MLPLHPRPQRCHGEPVHGPSSFPLVTTKIDNVAGIDYSLVAPPKATADNLDVLLKVRLTPRIIHPHTFASDHLPPPDSPSSLETDLMTPPLSYPSSLLSPVHSPHLLLVPVPLALRLFLKCTATAPSPGPLHLHAAPSKQEALAQISTETLPFLLQVFAQISSP